MNTFRTKWYDFLIFEGSKRYLAILALGLLGSSIIGYFIPPLLRELPENYHNKDLFFSALEKLGYIYLMLYANRLIYQLTTNKYINKLVFETRTYVYERWILSYEISLSDRYPQGEVIARIMSDTTALKELVTSGAFGILIDICFVSAFLVSFIKINKFSGFFLAGFELLAAVLLIWGGKFMREYFHQVRKAKGEVSQAVANVVGGLGEAYFNKNEEYASKTGTVKFNLFLDKQLKANVWDASYYSIAESLYPILLALVVFIFPYSQITQAAIILVIVDLIQQSINPIKSVAGKITNIQRAATGLTRINEFTSDLVAGLYSPKNAVSRPLELEKLDVNIASFEYPSSEDELEKGFRLKNISFSGAPGELIGLVGNSGCGKSTVLNIMAANLIPTRGELTIYDKNGDKRKFPGDDIADIVAYRECVGIVSQDSHIFSESLIFNITLSKERPEKFDQFWSWVVGQIPYLEKWGINPSDTISPDSLSMGQNQLISAIRSCYLKKTIVLFDEISSALDSELEMALRKVVLLIQQSSLTFIVAHRLETIIHASQIIVLAEGEIIAAGSHQKLLEDSGEYREFIEEMSH
ncbi:MAG: ABC transporter ATP-binding protein [Halobacteriovoraceae bacterium]|jgi:ABC-type multidrug transport system fused ATPase/permease subunit|nr:ABC transporter ATP-binding protein [Halobacteriovoraceae bacterium]MBT5094205.1 ABC transporter ATP-binding protein [Halobacteriovoraceae bacterium]